MRKLLVVLTVLITTCHPTYPWQLHEQPLPPPHVVG